MRIDFEKEKIRAELLGSLLEFTKTFYPLLTGREFIISCPQGRESHVITICRELTRAFRLELSEHRSVINVPPGHGKSTLLSMWVAWTMAHYPDSRYLYISYAKTLATKHTEIVKRIMSLSHYKYLFDVHIRSDSTAKDLFQTTAGGQVAAFGSGGAITGQDAGLPALDRFSGAVIIDDPHKPDEVASDTMRENVIDNYKNTVMQRPRGINVPQIFIGQRLHEADLAAYLLDGEDGHFWDRVILQSIDECGNALYPEAFPLEMLRIRQEKDIYVFAAQHQQDPVPAGGALFNREMFVELEDVPHNIVFTFITADTAETEKSYNDATAMGFWGLYEIEIMGRPTGKLGMHCLDCWEIRVEPKDLKDTFLSFYSDCLNFRVHPLKAAIERKSTGATLVSVLKDVRGLEIIGINRDRSSGTKTDRYLEMQPYLASKLISVTKGAAYSELLINHMLKITANNSHRHDDICDMTYDAVKIALIDETIYKVRSKESNHNQILSTLGKKMKSQTQARMNRNVIR